MISDEMEALIRRLYCVEGWRIGTIARHLRTHRCVVERRGDAIRFVRGSFFLEREWKDLAKLNRLAIEDPAHPPARLEFYDNLKEEDHTTNDDEAKIGRFKPMVQFDWSWPEKIDFSRRVQTLSFEGRMESEKL